MKQKLIYIIVFALAFAAGCTRNNGDIGPLFGLWHVDSVAEPDGTPVSRDADEFWAFQNTTIRVSVIEDHQTKHDAYGNWRMEDNTLFLDFPADKYAPWPTTGLPRSCSLQVLKLKGDELVLRRDTEEGATLIYTLKKM